MKGYTYTPEKEDEGYWNIQAIGKYGNKEIKSEPVPIRVYLGKIYEAVPIIEKDKFLNLASILLETLGKRQVCQQLFKLLNLF